MQGRVAYALGYTGLGVAAGPLRRRGDARPARRSPVGGDRLGVRAAEAAAVPARAVPLRRHPGHPVVARPRRPHGGQPQPLAAHRSTASVSASTAERARRAGVAPTAEGGSAIGDAVAASAGPATRGSPTQRLYAAGDGRSPRTVPNVIRERGRGRAAPPRLPPRQRPRDRRSSSPCGCAARSCSRARRASARPRSPRCWPAGPAASSSACSATRASTSVPGRVRVGLLPPAAPPAGRRGERRGGGAPASTSWSTSSTASASSCKRPLLRAIDHREGPAADPADRRGRSGRRRVRGVPARSAVRLPDHGARARHVPGRDAADRHPHLEPHPRRARRAEAPLPVPLGRAPELRARGRDRAAAGARGAASSWPARCRRRSRRCAALQLYKPPGVAETIDWATSLGVLGAAELDEGDRRGDARHRRQVPRRSGAGPPARRRRPRASRPSNVASSPTADRRDALHGDAGAIAVAFARVLRGGGLTVPIGSVLTFAEALAEVGLDGREPCTGRRGRRSCAARRTCPLRPGLRRLLGAPRIPDGSRRRRRGRCTSRSPSTTATTTMRAPTTTSRRRTTTPRSRCASRPSRSLRNKDFAAYSPRRAAAAHQLMADLRLVGAPRRSPGGS